MADHDHEDNEDRIPGFVRGSATSENAARSINGRKRRDQGLRVFDLYRAGETYTSDEVQVELGLLHQSGSPRVNELARAGCIVMTGETRTTGRGGKPANVWKWVPGTSGDDYKAWLKGHKKSVATYKEWLNAFKAAGAAYKRTPTAENLEALGEIAKAEPVDPSVTSANSDDCLATPQTTIQSLNPPLNSANDDFDDDDVIAWALGN